MNITQPNVIVSPCLKFIVDGKSVTLYLRGIIYLGAFHFTSRIISVKGNMWYHDRITTGRRCVNDGHLQIVSNEALTNCVERKSVLIIYAQE